MICRKSRILNRILLLVTILVLGGLNSVCWALNLSGSVYLGGSPLAESTVILQDSETLSELGHVQTDLHGNYQISVSAGLYQLKIQPPLKTSCNPYHRR